MSWQFYFDLPINIIKDIYWRGIPERCRDCSYVYVCRSGWKQGRKCHKGCVMLNNLREWKREADREDYLDNLVAHFSSLEKKSAKKLPSSQNKQQ